MTRQKKKTISKKSNPLYEIFEQHLFTFDDCSIDRKVFVEKVTNDYLKCLRRKNVTVAAPWVEAVKEEIGMQVNSMLLKKIYGFYDIQEYRQAKNLQPSTGSAKGPAKEPAKEPSVSKSKKTKPRVKVS